MRRTWKWIVALSFCLFGHTVDADSDHGYNPFPIWSPLTSFELSAINNIRGRHTHQADELLAIALVASGVRHQSDYDEVVARLNTFNQQVKKHITSEADPWLKGKLLNLHMHRSLLRSQDDSPPGYDLDQSRLMGIFETGQYNCISSALLYAVITTQHNLKARGVLLPSHAFIELQLPEGRQIDVETTSTNGYDQVHDQAFYDRTNQEWFSSRALEPATYDDYLQRERVALYQLATRNMLNQHTGKQQMLEENGFRLAEISAFLDPNYALAQVKRLYFYNLEIHKLILRQDWKNLGRLVDLTYATVLEDARQFADNEDLQRALQMYLSGAMLGYAQMGAIDPTLEVMGELLNRDWQRSESPQELRDRVANAVSLLLTQLTKQKQFDEAQLILSLVEGHIGEHPAWVDMTHWLYMSWAQEHWREKRWEDVIFTLKDIQHLTPPERSNQHPMELIESAYYNWVLELTEAKDFATAEGVTEQCRIQIDPISYCHKAAKLLKQQQSKQNKDGKWF